MKTQSGETLDLGGKSYKTVNINGVLWMAENLALLVKDSWFYQDDARYGSKHGMLYTWQAAMETCPQGWKLPSVEDWQQMINSFGNESRAVSDILEGRSNGLNIPFSGYRTQHGDFLSLDRAADFWTSTEAGESNAWLRYIIYKKEKVFKIIDDKRCGFSVRYIKER
ncbi:MAG: FISUMP domain-containing protein [Bacteroidota bacterium]